MNHSPTNERTPMPITIRFTFENCTYTAPEDFYTTNRARLPDGRIVTTRGWLESYPPRPQGIHVEAPDEIAPDAAEPVNAIRGESA